MITTTNVLEELKTLENIKKVFNKAKQYRKLSDLTLKEVAKNWPTSKNYGKENLHKVEKNTNPTVNAMKKYIVAFINTVDLMKMTDFL